MNTSSGSQVMCSIHAAAKVLSFDLLFELSKYELLHDAFLPSQDSLAYVSYSVQPLEHIIKHSPVLFIRSQFTPCLCAAEQMNQ
ncbi:unnamed protein product [Mycena citricolor]|uniref:Uncharacterized protein n=1 Tax=Mycena citricolor TaxID=2018698 RepID=A0AAD2K8Q4_9AGAR|nr:unnamed protein product [Mycena citricolor]